MARIEGIDTRAAQPAGFVDLDEIEEFRVETHEGNAAPRRGAGKETHSGLARR